jgi:hypothetical protein
VANCGRLFSYLPHLYCWIALVVSLPVDECILSGDLFNGLLSFFFASEECVGAEERGVNGAVHIEVIPFFARVGAPMIHRTWR